MNIFCWDFDGTLVHSNSLWSNSLFKALNETDPNHNVLFSDIRLQLKTGFTWHTPYNNYSSLTGEKWWDYMNVYLNLGVHSDTAEKACRKIRKVIKRRESYVLYDDTIGTLEAMENKGINIILSNNYPDMEEVVEKLGLLKYFDRLVVSSLVGYDKPRTELFDYAKSFYPGENNFYMIGDNPAADIDGGKNAGMTTVLVHRGHSENADYCFDNLFEITQIIP